MSVVAEQTPAATSAPAEPSKSVSDVLYEPAPVETAATSDVSKQEPAQKQDTDPAPAKADATPPADAKQEPVAKADEKPDPVAEQLKSQTAAAKRLGREKADLEKRLAAQAAQMEELIARANGTYQEPPKPSPELITAQADFRGREKASRPIAEQTYGADEVQKSIYDDESPYVELVKEKPWLHVEVSRDPQPAVKAMQLLRREAFVEKYGNDPRTWEEKIIEGAKPKLFEEFKKQLETQPVGKEVPTVSTARNAGGSHSVAREKSMADILYDGK